MADTYLSDLFAAYDTFIIGSSGVLTSPDGAFCPGAEDALAGLAEQGKQVIIYDNSSLLPAAHFVNPHWRKWADKGFGFTPLSAFAWLMCNSRDILVIFCLAAALCRD